MSNRQILAAYRRRATQTDVQRNELHRALVSAGFGRAAKAVRSTDPVLGEQIDYTVDLDTVFEIHTQQAEIQQKLEQNLAEATEVATIDATRHETLALVIEHLGLKGYSKTTPAYASLSAKATTAYDTDALHADLLLAKTRAEDEAEIAREDAAVERLERATKPASKVTFGFDPASPFRNVVYRDNDTGKVGLLVGDEDTTGSVSRNLFASAVRKAAAREEEYLEGLRRTRRGSCDDGMCAGASEAEDDNPDIIRGDA
jgi:hypothetical protein